MAWKNTEQHTFADALFIEHDSIKELDSIHELVDWQAIEQILKNIHSDQAGEKAYHPVMMFKCLLLQVWYKLSDPALEKTRARDLMFRRFAGIGLTDGIPDHSTLWRFRNLLEKEGHYTTLLQEINTQLLGNNLMIKQGEVSIIDKVNGAARERVPWGMPALFKLKKTAQEKIKTVITHKIQKAAIT